MYKSPVELIYQGTEMQIERGILRAVHKQDINVDREELIRALQYDRNQYEKGYQDGLADGGVVHGHKVVRSRNRGIAFAMKCPICYSKIPSNKPFTENVEYCSICGKKLDDTFQNYCPNCGAKMDGDENHATE